MIIDVPRMHISLKAWEVQQVLRYVKYRIIPTTNDLEEWTFNVDGEEVVGREILGYGPLPGIPDEALTEKGRKQERELNKLLNN